MAGRHRDAQPAGIAHRPYQPSARSIDIVVIDQRRQSAGGPARQVGGQRAVVVLEKRPGQEGLIGHGALSRVHFAECFNPKTILHNSPAAAFAAAARRH
jgi:hypothetical protein